MGSALWLAAQWLLAPGFNPTIRRVVREQMAPLGSGRWLDVGCGPRSLVAQALPGTLVGIDSVTELLHETQRDGVVCVCASAAALPFAAASFDGVVCFGLLHHLNDTDADLALGEMCRVLRPDGSILLLDNVRPSSGVRRPLAVLLRSLDRGGYIRTEDALRRLLECRSFHLGPRFTYSWAGLEGCWAKLADGENQS